MLGALLKLRGLLRGDDGNFVVAFSLAMGVLAMVTAGALSVGGSISSRADLQAAADAAALAAAQELALANAEGETIKTIAANHASGMIDAGLGAKVTVTLGDDPPPPDDGMAMMAMAKSAPDPSKPVSTVTVRIKAVAKSRFGDFLKSFPTEIEAIATARIAPAGKICVIILEETAQFALDIDWVARLEAPTCAVYSNSVHKWGIVTKLGARLYSSFVCTAGGYLGLPQHYLNKPVTDCPSTEDPLAARPAPSVGGCTGATTAITLDAGMWSLNPGVYCNGLTIKGTADVLLKPGVYIFKDGPLIVDGAAKLTGENAGLYFTGTNATLTFTKATEINLKAPTNGPMAGILVWEDRKQPLSRKFLIMSDKARELLGTIYVSRSYLEIDADGPVADKSAYTAIVARRMKLVRGPTLVLNSNYSNTNVPVPDGLGEVGGDISLVQ